MTIASIKACINHYVENSKLKTTITGYWLNVILNKLLVLIESGGVYKSYITYITQTEVNAPTSTEVRNDVGVVTWGYILPGFYTITSIGAFPATKVLSPNTVAIKAGGNGFVLTQVYRINDDTLGVNAYRMDSADPGSAVTPLSEDDILSNHLIEVKIY